MSYRIGIDVGGTFTDFVLARADGSLALSKEPTSWPDQSEGVLRGIARLAAGEGMAPRALLEATELVVHGTTTADNTMIEMNGAKTGLLTTEGHRDEIEIRRGYKEDIWDPAAPPPVPIAKRRHRLGIPERLDFRGAVVTPLDEEAVRAAARRLARDGIESIAVCLLFSYVNPAHEQRVRELLREELPQARVSLSHEVMPTAPEFERTSTTLVDAYVGPRVEHYLRRLEQALRDGGYRADLLIMQSNGGIMTADFLAKRAVASLGSGPTGGVMGACALAERSGERDVIAIDMGGTSYEACLVRGARPPVKSSWNWQHRYLVGLPMVELHSIGAGGGSIARVEAGALRVGPESAKAVPGPICYGRGGKRPTVTDANLLLGYINPESLCGGDFKLESAGVADAIREQIGRPLGLDAVEAAHGIFRIVNANMANAIRRVSSHAGHDPRQFTMVVYGGNGPVHAGMQAEELGIRRLLVPKTSPAFSALGLLLADTVVDAQRSYIVPSRQADVARVNAIFDELERAAEQELATAKLARKDLAFRHFVNLCYPGQTFDMAVPAQVGADGRMRAQDLERTVAAFHDLHEELHAFAVRDEEPVLRSVRVQTLGRTRKPSLPEQAPARGPLESALRARRPAYFGGRFVDTPVYDGEALGAGHRIEGPAIVEERFTTIVVYPGHVAELDRHGNYAIELPARAGG
ncbi:MAG TPA: hydantoinase/oxoprolinase family protein [Myxococcota bacterium]|nr:hydantoinase/oxoprolinase family protein [Myxococcota bacterium]